MIQGVGAGSVALLIVLAISTIGSLLALMAGNPPALSFEHVAFPFAAYAIAYYYGELYDFRRKADFDAVALKFCRALCFAAVLIGLGYLAIASLRPTDELVSSIALVAPLIALPAAFVQLATWMLVHSRMMEERILILGSSPIARRIAAELRSRADGPSSVVGFVTENSARADDGTPLASPVVGGMENLRETVTRFRPHRIVVALAERRNRLPVTELLDWRSRGVRVENGIRFYEELSRKLAIESLTPSDLLFAGRLAVPAWKHTIARVASFCFAVLAFVLCAPILPLLALAVRLSSEGPILFVQERIGLQGKPFRLLKFRTMRETAKRASEWEQDNIDRVTAVGYWLRKFRLDELPQFWNIFRGDMNLIGPRPHPVTNSDLFTREIPYYSLRSMVRPGLTGWAQVQSGYAQDLAGETEKMRYDLYYIANQSLLMDLHIVLKTAKVVFFAPRTEPFDEPEPVEVVAPRAERPAA